MAKSGRGIAIAERRELVLQLRKSGMALRAIAAAATDAGYTCTYETVRGDINACLARSVKEQDITTEKIKALEIERLDAMLKAIWPKVEAGEEASIDRALRISERRAKLLGIDAPKQLEIENKVIDINIKKKED